MATKLAALQYPHRYQAAARAMVTRTQALAASVRSDHEDPKTGDALIAAGAASQRFYKLLGIPSVCTTTSG
jgi:hypothetical protein